MSGAFMLATDNSSTELEAEFFGLALSRADKALSRLAKELGVLPLSSFVSVDVEDRGNAGRARSRVRRVTFPIGNRSPSNGSIPQTA